jgi:predicted metalloprotease with PDZ domain
MTQYYGDVMSYRDGIRPAKNWPDHVAAIYANYDNQQGRQWRSLGDTATAAPFLYGSPRGYGSERRGVDFYTEGELMWLKADSIVRDLSHNTKSLDTFARAFFGGKNTGPETVPYSRADIIAGLNGVVPYDWAGFFHTWVDEIAIHPPNGFEADGWKLVYTDQPSNDVPQNNFVYSLGFSATPAGAISDVHFGSPAWKAGLGLAWKLVAVNGREYTPDLVYAALKNSQRTHQPVTLMIEKDDMFRTVSIPYFDGPRYPHLVRIPSTQQRLTDVVQPYTK